MLITVTAEKYSVAHGVPIAMGCLYKGTSWPRALFTLLRAVRQYTQFTYVTLAYER